MKLSTSTVSEPQTGTPTWQWQNWEGLPYLTCSLLERWQHGFFTRQFHPRSAEESIAAWQPVEGNYTVKQVHGNRVLLTSQIDAKSDSPSADGIVTDRPGQAIWVTTADCTPVSIGDVRTGMVAAVHAGWRGTALRIVPEAIDRLLALGSRIEDLRLAMGPAIAGEVYQVSKQVAAEVGASILSEKEALGTEEILETLWQLPDSPILEDAQPGRVRLDVRRVNALQMEGLGIAKEQIAIAPYCTYQQPEYFFSYRRAPEKKVQWSGIASIRG